MKTFSTVCEVLAERLRSLGQAELVLLAAAVLKSTEAESVGRRWLAAVGGHITQKT